MPLSGSYLWGRVDAPQMSGWVWKFSRLILSSFPASFVKRFLLEKAFLGLPLSGPTPGAGWMPPRCPGGSGTSPDYYLYHFQQVLLKEFCSKMHSWACPCRGPTPGAGWTPPDVQVGQEILQIATYIISIKFCICGPILSHNVTPHGPLKQSYS